MGVLGNLSIPAMERLNLASNNLTDGVVKELIDQKFKNLKYVSLVDNWIRSDSVALKDLRAAYPSATIEI